MVGLFSDSVQQPRCKRKDNAVGKCRVLAKSALKPGPCILSWMERDIKTGRNRRIGREQRSQQTSGLSQIKALTLCDKDGRVWSNREFLRY